MSRSTGLILIMLGGGVLLVGVLAYRGWLNWFRRLPGDIRYESVHVSVYIPIVTMLIISLVLSLIFYLVRRFF